ncbi:MAG: aspartate/glutamate racemase family protein, partial [Bacillota bacterium]
LRYEHRVRSLSVFHNRIRTGYIMDKKRIGLIRVLTTDDPEVLGLHGRLIMDAFPDLEVVSRCIPGHPKGVYDDSSEEEATPKVVALAEEMAEDGVSAIIVSCAADPGVADAREVLDIPVIGAGRAASYVGLALSKDLAVLGLTEDPPKIVSDILGPSLLAASKPGGVKTTLDLMTPEGKKSVLEEAARLKAKGAKALVLACTGMATIGAAKFVGKELGIMAIDPVIAAGLFAWYATTDSFGGAFSGRLLKED